MWFCQLRPALVITHVCAYQNGISVQLIIAQHIFYLKNHGIQSRPYIHPLAMLPDLLPLSATKYFSMHMHAAPIWDL